MTTYQIVSIDGNIASGKTTFFEEWQTRLKGKLLNGKRVIFAPEPVNDWQTIKDENGITIVEKFYKNQIKFAFSFQMMAYISRLSILRKIIRDAGDEPIIIITERSLFTDKHIFAKMLYDQGKIEQVDYQIYLKWFQEFADDFPVNHCVYIRADPETCFQRTKKRSRVGENIPLEYLEECHRYHEDYIFSHTPIVIDGNQDVFKQPELVTEWIERISNSI